jgi:carboxypeptidase Q
MQSTFVPGTNSFNLIAEIKGSKYPEQIILLGGHIDSWDTGYQTGANDDAGGVISCLQVLNVLKSLGFKPKRTLRFIAWSGEEESIVI